MNLGAVALKLRAANTRFGNRIVGTAELALAQEYTLKDETAFVVPLSETMRGPNDNDTWVKQRVVETFGIVCAVKNDSAVVDKLGIKAFDTHQAVRAELFRAILGWEIPGAAVLTYYAGGRLHDITPAWMWYMFEFTSEVWISSEDYEGTLPAGDDFLKVYTQYKIDGDPVLPLTGASPQLPTSLLTPTVSELFGPAYSYSDAFSTAEQTLKSEATK